MKINSTNSNDTQEELNNLNKVLRNKVNMRENEIENIKKYYDKRADQARDQGQIDYENQITANDKKLLEANTNYTNKLTEYQANLLHTKNELEKEINNYKDSNASQINAVKKQNEERFQSTFQNAIDTQEELQQKTASQLHLIDNKSHQDKTHLEEEAHNQLSQMAFNFSENALVNESQFRQKLQDDLKAHQAELIENKDQFKKGLDNVNQKNHRIEVEQTRIHNDQIAYMDKFHKETMAQKENDFKKRLAEVSKDHDRVINELKTKLDQEIKDLTLKNAKTRVAIEDKAQDPFYRIEELDPQIKFNEKDILVSLAVPEHEKDNVHVIAQGRTVKVTLSKKYNESIDNAKNEIDKISKTELMSKELKVPDLLNSKKMAMKYENGVLTYKIAKL